MTWRTVVISSNSKIDLKLNYLVIRTDVIRKVHLSEISVLIIESTAVSLTSMLLCELSRRGISILFCDESHNPYGQLLPLYGCHNSSEKLRDQINWNEQTKNDVWAQIIKKKIEKQADVAKRMDYQRSESIRLFAGQVTSGDQTNREGHAAKVYFNTIFGRDFSRKKDCVINSCLNYGYAILLSAVNRELSSLGYNTQLGIHHDNVFNHFNLGCDLMEPIRPAVDNFVLNYDEPVFNSAMKHELANILNIQVEIEGKKQYLTNGLRIYIKSVTDALDSDTSEGLIFCEYEC